MSFGRSARVLLAVSLVLLVAALPFVRLHRSSVGAPVTVRAGAAGQAATTTPPYVTSRKPNALIVGDSFAEGITGVTRPGGGFARQVAQQMGWNLDLDGQGGTGYLAQGPVERFHDRAPFPARITRHSSLEDFSYILLTGGANDFSASDSGLAAAVSATITTSQQMYPKAKIIVVAPMWVHAKPPSDLLRLRNVIREQAAALHVGFIDPLAEHWTTAENEAAVGFTDHVHPSQAGHDYFAQRLVQDLVNLGVPLGEQLPDHSWFPPLPPAST